MIAQAEKSALTTRGGGDAQAAAIYAKAYKKSPQFFSFLRSLDAYQTSFRNKDDVMVIAPDSDFFRFMQHRDGRLK